MDGSGVMRALGEELGREQMARDVPGMALGAIWNTSWGYDQTQVEFFEVVRETLGTITLRRIGAEVRDGRLYPVRGTWATDWHLMGNPGEPERERDEARGYSEKVCRKPRTDRNGYEHRSVRIDDVRYAWPYDGGGCYDSDAAGQPGH